MTPAAVNEHGPGGSAITIVPPPRRRIFRRLTRRGRLAAFAWRWAYRLLFYPSPSPATAWRIWLLKLFGADIATGARIHPTARIVHPWNLTLGRGVTVFHCVILDCQAPVTIGPGTRISQFSHLCTATHAYNQCKMPIVGKPISIGRDCWLAADVFIGSGVTVGDHSVLGARCSVFRDVPAGVIVAGSPSHEIRANPAAPEKNTD